MTSLPGKSSHNAFLDKIKVLLNVVGSQKQVFFGIVNLYNTFFEHMFGCLWQEVNRIYYLIYMHLACLLGLLIYQRPTQSCPGMLFQLS